MVLPAAPLFLLLLSVLHVASSHHQQSHHFSSLPYLSSRAAFPRDVVGNWTFIYSEKEKLCPGLIQHLGFNRRKKGRPIRVFHHRIIQDAVRCKNKRKLDGRRFRIFHGNVVKRALKNRTTLYRIPNRLVNIVRLSPPVRRAFRAANRHGENYFIGFEGKNRYCGDRSLFKRGTTGFLLRPKRKPITIKGIPMSFKPGKRYLIMIPRFKRTNCVYSAEIRQRKVDTVTPDEDNTETAGEEAANELAASPEAGECFPATVSVQLADGRKIFMEDLSVRDSVQVGTDLYASVFMFTHRLRSSSSVFRRIELHSGEQLDVTGGHYVYANGRLITASQVRLGDMMPLANGTHARVTGLYTVAGVGLFNPHTTVGDIVVNGIRVSTYTETIKPRVAHTMLAPVRATFKMLEVDLSFGYFNGGGRFWKWFGALLR